MQPIESNAFIEIDECARLLHVSAGYLARKRCEGGGPPFHRVHARKILYRAAEVQAWIEARRFENTSAPLYA